MLLLTHSAITVCQLCTCVGHPNASELRNARLFLGRRGLIGVLLLLTLLVRILLLLLLFFLLFLLVRDLQPRSTVSRHNPLRTALLEDIFLCVWPDQTHDSTGMQQSWMCYTVPNINTTAMSPGRTTSVERAERADTVLARACFPTAGKVAAKARPGSPGPRSRHAVSFYQPLLSGVLEGFCVQLYLGIAGHRLRQRRLLLLKLREDVGPPAGLRRDPLLRQELASLLRATSALRRCRAANGIRVGDVAEGLR